MTDRGPSPEWWNAQLPPELRAIGIVQQAIGQIDGLVDYVTGRQPIEPRAVEIACTESFMVNVRLVADFLFKKREPKDLRAVDLVPGWKADTEAGKRIGEWWDLASKHVMHLSKKRIPEDIGTIQPLTEAEQRQMAADCREVYESFLAQYSAVN
ncbi:hypothetical protein [Streptomyces sp. NPDC088246]|uniref:hypothetical protein n=1 Tax=Streptomyces sp. NPDC088246 TaxID=3365842 RepID=UPI0037FE9A41